MTETRPKCPIRLCTFCGGQGKYEGFACPACGGGRFGCVTAELGKTRAYKSRVFLWNPGLRNLTIWRDEKKENYEVVEFRPDLFPGEALKRAWRLTKQSDGAVYYCKTGGIWHTCDCKGFEARGVAKANDRAQVRGENVVLSFGCVHLDALLNLLAGGWLELPEVTDE